MCDAFKEWVGSSLPDNETLLECVSWDAVNLETVKNVLGVIVRGNSKDDQKSRPFGVKTHPNKRSK